MSTKGTHIPDRLKIPFAGITPAPSQEKGQDLFPTGNWRSIRPVYRDKLPPCNNACGTNEKIQGYLDLVKRGKYLDAYALIKEDMPFPSVTGRVCYHPCEQACNRGKYDEAISIRAVERFLGDLGQALTRDVVKAGTPNGKKVAVVDRAPPATAPPTNWRASATKSRSLRSRRKQADSIAAAFRTGCSRSTCSIARSSGSSNSESRSRPASKSART